MHVNFFKLVFEINCRDNPAVWIHVVMSTHDTSAQYIMYIGVYIFQAESGKEVNFTSITENFQKLSLSIQTLIENPPTLLKYNEEWFQSIIQRTGAILQTTFNDTRF